MHDDEALIQAMFDVSVACCGDVAADEACTRCNLMAKAAQAIARTRSHLASAYDLLKAHDVYGTGGDVSACAREVLQVVRDREGALHDANFKLGKIAALCQSFVDGTAPSGWGEAMILTAIVDVLNGAAGSEQRAREEVARG